MSKITILFFSLFMVATASCSDSPESPVRGKNPSNGGIQSGDPDKEKVTAMAIRYKGSSPLGGACDIYIALNEEEHDDHGDEHGEHDEHDHKTAEDEHDHAESFLIKVDYTTPDGHKPYAMEGQFKQVHNGNFIGVDPVIIGASINFISAEFRNTSITELTSVKQIDDLVKTNKFEQAFRVKLSKSLNFHAYEKALEETLEDTSTFAANKELLNNINSALLVLLHDEDHYHTPTCNFDDDGLGAFEVVETEFDMEAHDH